MSNGGTNFKNFLHLMAFCGVIIIALALALKLIFASDAPQVANILGLVAQIMAYLMTAVFALYYVISKRNAILTIIYAVAVIAIAVILIVAPF